MKVEVVPEELIEEFIAKWAPPEPPPSNGAPSGGFDIEAWIGKHLVKLEPRAPKPWNGSGRSWVLGVCPWDAGHKDSAFIGQFANGAIAAGCLHNSCGEKKWQDLRALFEPDAYKPKDDAEKQNVEGGEVPELPKPKGFELIEVNDLIAEPDVEQPWAVEGMIPAGGTAMCVCKPKVGKTVWGINLAMAVSRNYPFLGRKVKAGPVVYLALEGQRHFLKKQFQALDKAMPVASSERFPLFCHIGQAPVDALRQLYGLILHGLPSGHLPVLAVIDVLFKIAPVKDGNEYAEMSRLMEQVYAIAQQTDCTIAALHHSTKGEKEDAIDAPLGSTALAGGVDTEVYLRRVKGVRVIETRQRYGDDMPPTVVRMNEVTGMIYADGPATAIAGKAMEAEIVTYVTSCSGKWVITEAIHENVDGTKKPILQALKKLVDNGSLSRIGEGVKGDPHRYAPKGAEPPLPEKPKKTSGKKGKK